MSAPVKSDLDKLDSELIPKDYLSDIHKSVYGFGSQLQERWQNSSESVKNPPHRNSNWFTDSLVFPSLRRLEAPLEDCGLQLM